ncbi:molybdopterin synthase sulfur carrier subunit [Diabrotica undecimpunctata]|uniref:molybdopterin synthase sulfur carrier subunit n=1 Tax=Diabrotica undecimpunctata TaxID=50387 RepID=UPI003B637858
MNSRTVEISVLFFAKAREIVGKPSDTLLIESPVTHKQLLEQIVIKYSLQDIQNQIILSVNERFWQPNDIIYLNSGDEIAVIPPLSGG